MQKGWCCAPQGQRIDRQAANSVYAAVHIMLQTSHEMIESWRAQAVLHSGSALHFHAAGNAVPTRCCCSQQMPLAGSQVSPSGLNTVQAWGAGEGGACKQRPSQHLVDSCRMHGKW
jgi:hypothetical protein